MPDMSIDKPHSKYLHMFAVVRYDLPISPNHPQNSISVVKTFSTRALAEEEADRLRAANEAKGCTYEVQTTRFVK